MAIDADQKITWSKRMFLMGTVNAWVEQNRKTCIFSIPIPYGADPGSWVTDCATSSKYEIGSYDKTFSQEQLLKLEEPGTNCDAWLITPHQSLFVAVGSPQIEDVRTTHASRQRRWWCHLHMYPAALPTTATPLEPQLL